MILKLWKSPWEVMGV